MENVIKDVMNICLNTKDYGLHILIARVATAAANLGINAKNGRWNSEKVKDRYVPENLDSLELVSKYLGL